MKLLISTLFLSMFVACGAPSQNIENSVPTTTPKNISVEFIGYTDGYLRGLHTFKTVDTKTNIVCYVFVSDTTASNCFRLEEE